MINKIWALFIIIGIIVSSINGTNLNGTIINSGKNTLNIIIELLPLIAIWSGVMNIALKSGLLNKAGKVLSPVIKKVFPEIPDGHESITLIATDFIFNALGVGNASTPIGLKVMKSLQELNNNKKEASRSMITFLIMNTAGFTIIPTSIIALRSLNNSIDPMMVIPMIVVTSLITFILGLIIDRCYYFFRRRHG